MKYLSNNVRMVLVLYTSFKKGSYIFDEQEKNKRVAWRCLLLVVAVLIILASIGVWISSYYWCDGILTSSDWLAFLGNYIATREEIFLTTKVWLEHYGYEECKASVLESLKKLQVEYIDLMLLHQPFADYYGAWRALEDLYTEGNIRAIGVSNFYPDRLIDLASFARIKPMVNQVETHPFNQQIEAQKWMEKYDVQIESWAPFAEGRGGLFTNQTIAEIAKKYDKSVAQTILRWELQRGIVVIPKSVHKDRMQENFNVFDFTLTDEDMTVMASLDKEESAFFSHTDPNMVEWFVKIIEQRKNNRGNDNIKKNW